MTSGTARQGGPPYGARIALANAADIRALLRRRMAGKYVVVRTAGSASWRLEVAGSDVAVLALFVRDSVGLVVSSAPDVPPALEGTVADRHSVLSEQDREDASAQWLPWWRQILELELGAKRSRRSAPLGGPAERVVADLAALVLRDHGLG